MYRRGNKTRYLGSWAAYWKKRYFVLDRAALYCFHSKEEFEELLEEAHVIANGGVKEITEPRRAGSVHAGKKGKKVAKEKLKTPLLSPVDSAAAAAYGATSSHLSIKRHSAASPSAISFVALAKVFAEADTIPLEGYEVLVDTRAFGKKPCLEFELSRMDKTAVDKVFDRDLHFKAISQDDLKTWLQALVAATIVSQAH